MKPIYSFKNGSTIEPSHFEGIFKIIEQLSTRERLEKNGWTIDDGQVTEDIDYEIIEPLPPSKQITNGI